MELRPYARRGILDVVALSEEVKKNQADLPEMRMSDESNAGVT
jgi:hypothetical protein